jgi:hypothetical protein
MAPSRPGLSDRLSVAGESRRARPAHPLVNSTKLAWVSITRLVAEGLKDQYISVMCGRIIQSGGPLRYAIVDGLDVRDSRLHN